MRDTPAGNGTDVTAPPARRGHTASAHSLREDPMPTFRLPAVLVSVLLGLSALIAVSELTSATAWAQGDARVKAREAYLNGRKLYDEGEYLKAIAEFKTADKLAPSGVNDYNIGLSHEKLGNRAEAVMFYRSYLTRVPDASNRASVEASIAKLEGELGADDARAAEEARLAAEADARAAEDAARRTPPPGGGTRGGGAAATGDPELDRVSAVDVNAIRDQRQVAPPTGGGAVAAGGGAGGGPPPPMAPAGEPKKSKPIYKQWWFWVVVGVSAYVLISIAAADSDNPQARQAGFERLPMPSPGTTGSVGATLWTF